jgi:hypothetical protein
MHVRGIGAGAAVVVAEKGRASGRLYNIETSSLAIAITCVVTRVSEGASKSRVSQCYCTYSFAKRVQMAPAAGAKDLTAPLYCSGRDMHLPKGKKSVTQLAEKFSPVQIRTLYIYCQLPPCSIMWVHRHLVKTYMPRRGALNYR